MLGDPLQVAPGHPAGDVLAGKARGVEFPQPRVSALHRIDQTVERLVDEPVRADGPRDVLFAAIERDELARHRHVDTVDVLVPDRRRRGGEVHLAGSRVACLLNDLLRGGAANDRIVDQQHVLAFELEPDGVELASYRSHALGLPGHDERTLDVAILDEPLPVLHTEIVGERETRGSTGLRDGNHDVDVVVGPLADDLLRERLTHAQPRLVHRDLVDDGIGAREVDVFEYARGMTRLFHAPAGVDLSAFGDDHRFAGRQIADPLEPERVERDALRRHHVLGALHGLPHAEADRTNRARVPECHHAVAEDERHRRVAAETAPVDAGHRIEDGVLVEREPVRARKLARERVQQDLGVGLRVHVAQIVAKHLLAERPGIDQVAVVRERDAVRRVDVEGLRLVRRRAAGGRVTDVPDAHTPSQRLHVVGLEDIAHEPVGLALVDLAIAGEDARRILPAVLQRGQRVVEILVDVGPADDSDDTAHGSRIRMA